VVIGTALVASAGQLLSRWDNVKDVVNDRYPKVAQALHLKMTTIDTVPIDRWFWAAAAIFALCLVGSLLFVREPENPTDRDDDASAKQPLEITGV